MRGKTQSFDSASVASLANKALGNILIIGETLRNELASHRPPLIGERRYHLRSYQNCFVGKEVVSWLVQSKAAVDRCTAVQLMKVLQKYDIIHHVCDDHEFKDEALFFRFRMDDRSYPETRETKPYLQGTNIFHRLRSETSSPLMKLHTEFGTKHPESFFGAELVSWLVRTGTVATREKGLGLGKDLLEADLIRHVTRDHHFKDDRLLYQFNSLLSSLKFTDLLTYDQHIGMKRALSESAMLSLSIPEDTTRKHSNSSSSDSSMDRSPLPGGLKPDLPRSPDQNQNSLTVASVGSQGSLAGSLSGSSTHSKSESSIGELAHMAGSMSISPQDLRHPECPFVKQHMKISGDSVGFGLVIRGDGPTYVQTVDPKGPAAAAGLKVRQYLAYVNGTDVLDKNHTDVAKLILANPFELSLVVLSRREEARIT